MVRYRSVDISLWFTLVSVVMVVDFHFPITVSGRVLRTEDSEHLVVDTIGENWPTVSGPQNRQKPFIRLLLLEPYFDFSVSRREWVGRLLGLTRGVLQHWKSEDIKPFALPHRGSSEKCGCRTAYPPSQCREKWGWWTSNRSSSQGQENEGLKPLKTQEQNTGSAYSMYL